MVVCFCACDNLLTTKTFTYEDDDKSHAIIPQIWIFGTLDWTLRRTTTLFDTFLEFTSAQEEFIWGSIAYLEIEALLTGRQGKARQGRPDNTARNYKERVQQTGTAAASILVALVSNWSVWRIIYFTPSKLRKKVGRKGKGSRQDKASLDIPPNLRSAFPHPDSCYRVDVSFWLRTSGTQLSNRKFRLGPLNTAHIATRRHKVEGFGKQGSASKRDSL